MSTPTSTINWNKLTPATPKSWLFALAGMMWSGVGIFLCSLTVEWLKPVELLPKTGFIFGGVGLAIGIHKYGFSRFANNNIQRINRYPKPKVCIFAFQQWSSYPLVVFMISLGIFLRVYSPIPKPWLALMYIGIGGSLFLASFHYYVQCVRLQKKTERI
jgi:hypothetical protein